MVRPRGRPPGQFPGSWEREYIFMGKDFKSGSSLAAYIAKKMGATTNRISWQVLIFTRRFVVRHDRKIVFSEQYTDEGNYRIVKGTIENDHLPALRRR